MFRGSDSSRALLPARGEKVAEGRMRAVSLNSRRKFAGACTPHPPSGHLLPSRRGAGLVRSLIVLSFLLCLAACQRTGPSFQKMGRQPKYDPYEPSDFFADGMSARPRIAGTVARGEVSNNPFMDSGKIDGQDGDGFPIPVTAQLLDRGHQRFNIYCSECHGRIGDGNGMIPSRGFRRPPSFHTEALRNAKTGHFFDVMTNGFGAMPPYAVQVPVADRWAIVAYIRALQLSQNGTLNDVPAGERSKLGAVTAPAPAVSAPAIGAPAVSAPATSNQQPATATGAAQ
jgi:mono/diheme cytochrome c family protein